MRRFIFSINSGRSGSEYLARLLDTAGNASAFHEPKPDGAGRRITNYPATRPSLLDRVLYPPMYARKYWKKIRSIRATARTLPAEHAYIETNHMFILSFYDVVMRHLAPVEVIFMRRDLASTVRSFIELDHYTPQCPYTRFWFTSPNSPSAAATPLDRDENLDQVEQIIGYLVDIESRAQRFMRQFPDVKVVTTRIEDLNDRAKVEALFGLLALEATPLTWEMTGRVVNAKPEHKARVDKRVSLDFCRERIQAYLEKCARKGIDLPTLPQFSPQPSESTPAAQGA